MDSMLCSEIDPNPAQVSSARRTFLGSHQPRLGTPFLPVPGEEVSGAHAVPSARPASAVVRHKPAFPPPRLAAAACADALPRLSPLHGRAYSRAAAPARAPNEAPDSARTTSYLLPMTSHSE